MSMVTKLVRVVTNHKVLLPRNWHNPSMRWSCEVTSQFKSIIFSLTEDMNTELGKVLSYCERLPLLKPYDPLNKNFKNLYLHFCKTCGH